MKMVKTDVTVHVVEIVKSTVSGMDRIPNDLEIKQYIHAVNDALNEINNEDDD